MEIKFAGYHKEVAEAISLISDALRIIPEQKEWLRMICERTSTVTNNSNSEKALLFQKLFKPPKGLLIYGPSGVGKTRLMRELAKSFSCDSVELSYSILFEG